jgi:cytidylate kinase
MKTLVEFDKCQAFLDAQLRPGRELNHVALGAPALRAITISREAGCGAAPVAERLAQLLKACDKSAAAPWTVFDRNLIEQVLQDHNLPVRFAKYLPEDRGSEIRDVMDELFGVHPSTWTVVEHTAETILRLAHLGRVILIGRGANMITARLPGVFHVRLVAPLAERIEQAQHVNNMTPNEARDFIEREDKGRARYLKQYFEADADNPLHYHLVINTSLISYEEAAGLIFVAATGKARKEAKGTN